MNVLLTSVGRRTYMIEYFKQVLAPLGGKVFAVNSDLSSPALWIADGYAKAPLIYEANYKEFLLKYCLENKINLVISLFDIELPVLSRMKKEFEEAGVLIVVADEWLTVMANDKWKTQTFLKKNGWRVVNTFLSVEEFEDACKRSIVNFPVFVKPRWGMGSIAIYKADNIDELRFYVNKVKSDILNTYLKYESGATIDQAVLIQEKLPGEEYGLDIINDLKGNYCNTVVKKKLAMRSGETDAAITMHEPVLETLGYELAKQTRHPANMDVDVFYDGKEAYILELNPRFGGGYPFSHIAGVNVPQAIVNWYRQMPVNIQTLLTPRIGIKAMKGITIIQSTQ